MKLLGITALCVSFVAQAFSPDSSVAIAEGRQPRLAAHAGTVYCVYGEEEDIFVARSTDRGESFSAPVKVATVPNLMLGKRRGPRIAATGDAIVVSAISSDRGNLVSWRSVDGGKTWSESIQINDADRSCREGLHDMTSSSDGSIAAVWLDLRDRGTQLWGSISRDGGKTWETNRIVYRSPDGSICECCHPTLASNGNKWKVLWRNSLEGNRDVYVASSDASFETFSTAQRLGDANWRLAACPMDGGDLASGENTGWATWRRDKSCYATNLNRPSQEVTLGPGEQPVVEMTSAGPVFAWLSARPGELKFRSSGSETANTVSKHASDPDLASLDGEAVLCAFESIEDGKSIVRVVRLSDSKR